MTDLPSVPHLYMVMIMVPNLQSCNKTVIGPESLEHLPKSECHTPRVLFYLHGGSQVPVRACGGPPVPVIAS